MAVSCIDLSVDFSTGAGAIPALQGVSLTIGDGDFVSILGPSGCGKTTLLRVLAGLQKPSGGAVRFSGKLNGEGASWGLLVRQENSLFPWMTAVANAAFGLEMLGTPKAERERAASEMLARHGLGGREQAYPKELSAGMKQRVAVIRAFLTDPPLLLMDEPFGALDSQTRARLQQALLELWGAARKSILFVTHDVDEALLLSDRIVVLSGQPGKVLEDVVVPLAREDRREQAWSDGYLALRRRLLSLIELSGSPHL